MCAQCKDSPLKVRDCIARLTQQGEGNYKPIPATPPTCTGDKRPQQRGLQQSGAVRTEGLKACVAVHHPPRDAVTYGVTYGPNHSRNAQFVSSIEPMTSLGAEYMVIHKALQTVLGEVHLTVICCTPKGHVDVSISFHKWEGMGWVNEENVPF